MTWTVHVARHHLFSHLGSSCLSSLRGPCRCCLLQDGLPSWPPAAHSDHEVAHQPFGLHTRPIQGRTRSAAGQHPQLEVTAACHFFFTIFLMSSLSLPASLKPTIRILASRLKRANSVLGMVEFSEVRLGHNRLTLERTTAAFKHGLGNVKPAFKYIWYTMAPEI